MKPKAQVLTSEDLLSNIFGHLDLDSIEQAAQLPFWKNVIHQKTPKKLFATYLPYLQLADHEYTYENFRSHIKKEYEGFIYLYILFNAAKDGHLVHLKKIVNQITLKDLLQNDKHNTSAFSYAINASHVHVLNFVYWEIIIKRRQEENLPDDAYDSAGFYLIHWAAICDQTNEIQRLAKSETIDIKNQSGFSPLLLSVYFKNIAATRILLELKADPNTINSLGVTPLQRAAEEGLTDIAKMLVQAKANVLKTLPNEHTNAILIAKVNKHTEIFNMLYEAAETQLKEISQQKSPFVEDSTIFLYTNLFLATMDGDIGSIKKFLQRFPHIDINCYAYGSTLLGYAAESGHIEITQLLLGHRADPTKLNTNDYSPLLVALTTEHFDIAETLLHTTDISNFTDLKKFSDVIKQVASYADILVTCTEQGYAMTLELLLKHGGDPEASDSTNHSLLTIALNNNYIEIAELLLSFNVRVNSSSDNGFTSLHAATLTNLEIVTKLIDKGADINATMTDGFTPLFNAIAKKNLDIIRLLLIKGVQVNTELDDGSTPLHDAVATGDIEIVKIFLEAKANINSATKEGYTPLHIAAYHGNLEIIKTLVDAGAIIDTVDSEGNMPLNFAYDNGDQDVIDFLESVYPQSLSFS